MPAEKYAGILADLKPRSFTTRAKRADPGLLAELGADVEKTYFDVPRLRTMAHGEYMKAGLALQFHPHRDTWFSAPYQQLNWWLPVYEIEAENSMAFHLNYFDRRSRTAPRGTTTTSGTGPVVSRRPSRSRRTRASSRCPRRSSSSCRTSAWSRPSAAP